MEFLSRLRGLDLSGNKFLGGRLPGQVRALLSQLLLMRATICVCAFSVL